MKLPPTIEINKNIQTLVPVFEIGSVNLEMSDLLEERLFNSHDEFMRFADNATVTKFFPQLTGINDEFVKTPLERQWALNDFEEIIVSSGLERLAQMLYTRDLSNLTLTDCVILSRLSLLPSQDPFHLAASELFQALGNALANETNKNISDG
ncbi:MAG: hypothetical protein DUD32_08945 [Lactobacillus sp.]|nr:MAG: hypothetical protein DUD32_08945 [Lactobacillus sp.]